MTAGAERYERFASAGPMQIASSASWTGQGLAVGLAVGDDRLDAERPAGAQDAQRDLAAVGDEDLAEHRSGVPGRRRAVAELDDDELLAVLDGVARLHEARADEPVDRGTTSWATPSMSTMPSRSPARTRVPARTSVRGWKIPTAGDVATELGGGSAPSRPSRAVAAAGATGGRALATRRVRRADGRRAATRALGAAALAVAVGGAAQPDLPVALADLELAEAGRGELGDQGRQQLVGEAVDGGVVARPARRDRRRRRPGGGDPGTR